MDIKKLLFFEKEYIVVELGDFNIKAARFSSHNGKILLKDLRVKEMSGASDEGRRQILASMLKSIMPVQRNSQMKTVFILPQKFFVVRRIKIPSIPHNEIAPALKFKLKDEISWDVDKIFYRWVVVGEQADTRGRKTMELIVSVVLKETIYEVIRLSKAINLKCYGVYSQFFSLSYICGELDASENIAVLDIGGTATSFMIFRKNVPLFLRNIPFSSFQLTKEIASVFKQNGISPLQAEAIKREYGIAAGPESISKGVSGNDLVSCLRSPLEKLTSEIRKSIEYYEVELEAAPLTKLYLLGSGSRLKGLVPFLENILRKQVSFFPLPDSMVVAVGTVDKEDTAYLPVLVSALYEKRGNFLPARMQPSRLEDIATDMIRLGVPFVLLSYAIFLSMVNFQIKDYQKRLAYATMHLDTLKEIRQLRADITQREKVLTALDASYMPGDWIMKGISAVIPPQVVLDIVHVDEDKKTTMLEGHLLGSDGAEEIVAGFSSRLRDMPAFTEVNIITIIRQDQDAKGIVTFKISCKLAEF